MFGDVTQMTPSGSGLHALPSKLSLAPLHVHSTARCCCNMRLPHVWHSAQQQKSTLYLTPQPTAFLIHALEERASPGRLYGELLEATRGTESAIKMLPRNAITLITFVQRAEDGRS